jgi:hypothetical protein
MNVSNFRQIMLVVGICFGIIWPVVGQVTSFPWTEDFEQFGICIPDCQFPCPLNNGWQNVAGDDFDWIVHQGPTVSAQTGPQQGIEPFGGKYIYLESNVGCTGGKEALLLSPLFDFSSVNYPIVEFYYHAYGLGEGEIHLDVMINGQWQNDLIEPIVGSADEWQKRSVPIPIASGLAGVQLRWRGLSGLVETSDFAIDGIEVRESSNNDLSPVAISPASRLCGAGHDTLVFLVQNLGTQTQQTVETKVSWSNGPWGRTLQQPMNIIAGGQAEIRLLAPSLQPGLHTVRLISRAGNGNDNNPSNDTLVTTIAIRPLITSLPYLATFEVGPMHWYSEGTRNSWEHGAPRGNILNNTPDGNFCWGTNLGGNYEAFSYAFLYSPCFDLRKVTNETILSFDLKTNLEFGSDKLWLEYSLDGGIWQKLGTRASGILGWYNHSHNFWTGTPHGWRGAAHSLSALAGHMVQFRFVLYSDGSRQAEGAVLDRFMVRNAYDLALTHLLPDDVCDLSHSASENVTVTLENLGFYDIQQVDLQFQVDNKGFGPREPFLGVLRPGESHSFTFSKTANLASRGGHWVEARAIFPLDMVAENNIIRNGAGNYPPLYINLGKDTSICPGERLILKSGVVGGQYAWSTGNITQDLYVFTGGTFSLRVQDSVGCEATDTIIVDMPPAVSLDVQPLLPIACYGDSGILQVNTNGGIGPFDYKWSNGDSTFVTYPLSAGEYSLTITDAEGCQYRKQTTLIEPDPLQISIDTIVPVSCSRDSNGQIKVLATGGTLPYRYHWENGQTSAMIKDLKQGYYAIDVSDSNGCEAQLEPIFVPVNTDTAPVADFEYSISGGLVQFISKSQNISLLTWYFGDGERDIGTSKPNHEYNRNGLYPVTLVAQNACGVDTAIRFVNVISVDLEEIIPERSLSLYPIPLDGNTFFLQNNGIHIKHMRVTLTDPQGKRIKSWESGPLAPDGTKRFDVSTLAAGVYFVEAEMDGRRKMWKVPVGR